jgi:hypothetical protein
MKRVIFDLSKPKIRAYIVEDSYIRSCNLAKRAPDSLLITYLFEASISVSCLQEPLDIYQCNHIGDPGTLHTDGLWIWSADLNYYTEFHHFLWPTAFLDHIQKQNKASCSEARLDEISEVYLGTIVLIQHEFVLEERKVLEHTIEVLS